MVCEREGELDLGRGEEARTSGKFMDRMARSMPWVMSWEELGFMMRRRIFHLSIWVVIEEGGFLVSSGPRASGELGCKRVCLLNPEKSFTYEMVTIYPSFD